MGRGAFHEFDLRIEPEADDVWRVRVAASPVGAAGPVLFRLPTPPGGDMPADQSFGAELFDRVFAGPVGVAWNASLAIASTRDARLRLTLRAPMLAELPWELLYDRRAPGLVGRSDRSTLVRLVDSATVAHRSTVEGPLRIVVVFAGESVRFEDELRWADLQNAVESLVKGGRIILERLYDTSARALAGAMRRRDTHVLHIVRDGADLETGALTVRDLEPLVADHLALRLVVLDRRGPAAMDVPAFGETAVRLVRHGCPAVLTMRGPMSDTTAAVFARSFYALVAQREPVDVALTVARQQVEQRHPRVAATWALFAGRSASLEFGEIQVPPPAAYRPDAAYQGQTAAPPPPVGTQVRPPSKGSVWGSLRDTVAGWLSPSRSPAPPSTRRPPPRPGTAPPTGTRTAYPLIDVRARRHLRPNVVVVEEPFDVTVGLARYQDPELAQTSGIPFAPARQTALELVLTFDPSSLVALGPTRLTLAVSDESPYPSIRAEFSALYRPDLPTVRRIGVHYLRDGQVVGIAWRRFVVALSADAVATAGVPPPEPNPLIDLEPLLGADLPDLVLSVCASDGAATGEFVWTAYAASSAVVVPDAPRISNLDNDLQQFVGGMRDTVAYSDDPYAAYLSLVGKATRLGRAVPPAITSVVRQVVEGRGRRAPAAVLLLTEELTLPWELAVFDPPLDTPWGGTSPFLGAHAAISRWPLTQHRPRPTPRPTVTVRRAAVVAADYAGVPGWSRLDHALAEAAQVAALFAPPAVTVAPSLTDVVGMLRGVPAADVLHVALHGRFDATGFDDGLVLLATEEPGSVVRTAQLLTPDQVETGRLDGGPFVFLNACQVASDKRVLGDYGGFASTLLRIGATGVVAPLWSVDDDVAAEFARRFYAATWSATGRDGTLAPTSVAEAVRALRAQYTEAAAEAHTDGVTATLIAFQVFGHPRLRLAHV